MYLSLSLFLPLSFCWSGYVFSSIWSNVSKVKDKSLKNSSLKVFSKCICHCQYHCLCLSVGQVVFSNHSDQLSQRSKVSMISMFVPKSESVAVQPHIETLSGQQVPVYKNYITSFVRTHILGHQERLHYVMGQKPVVGRWGVLLFIHDFLNSVSGVVMV